LPYDLKIKRLNKSYNHLKNSKDIINQVHPVLSPNLGLVNSDVVVQYLGFSGGNIFSLLDDPNNRLDATLRAFGFVDHEKTQDKNLN
jgi:hypothetical protein